MMVILLGKHILAPQMVAIFEHENMPCRHCHEVGEVVRASSRGPVLLWATDNRSALLAGFRLRLAGYHVHRYWIGGDVLAISKVGRLKKRLLVTMSKWTFHSNTTNAVWLSDELTEAGLESAAMPFGPVCCANHCPLSPLPSLPYTVLHYSLPGCDHIYRPELVAACAAANPDIAFICIGNPTLEFSARNVKILGSITPDAMRSLYASSHCLLRVTSHDGLPRMVLEALAHGLDVVTNLPVPHTTQARTAQDVVVALGQLMHTSAARNLEARKWYFETYSASAWARYWQARLYEGGSLWSQ
jgi:hypothetical protein